MLHNIPGYYVFSPRAARQGYQCLLSTYNMATEAILQAKLTSHWMMRYSGIIQVCGSTHKCTLKQLQAAELLDIASITIVDDIYASLVCIKSSSVSWY